MPAATETREKKANTDFLKRESGRLEKSPITEKEEKAESETGNLVSESNSENPEKQELILDASNIDDNLPSTVQVLKTPHGCKCYLIGTVHFSLESQEDVSKIIRAVKPEVVVVELCSERIHVLELDEETILKEAKNLDYSKITNTIRQNGLYRGVIYLLLLDLSAKITKVLGLAPGGEFRRALTEAKKLFPNCLVVLGDRSIKVTFGRAVSALSWWQTLRLAWHLLTIKDIIPEDLELYKSRDALDEMLEQLTAEYPELARVFVKERDIFLAHSLQTACEYRARDGDTVKNVVGVVGMGHVPGIIEHWGKVRQEEVIEMVRIPPQTFTTRVLKATVKISLLAGVCYLGYRLVPISASAFRLVKSSVSGLLESSKP